MRERDREAAIGAGLPPWVVVTSLRSCSVPHRLPCRLPHPGSEHGKDATPRLSPLSLHSLTEHWDPLGCPGRLRPHSTGGHGPDCPLRPPGFPEHFHRHLFRQVPPHAAWALPSLPSVASTVRIPRDFVILRKHSMAETKSNPFPTRAGCWTGHPCRSPPCSRTRAGEPQRPGVQAVGP